ncbi:hypothetical protein ACTXT7_002377 [Hymenolepis weldensis]
MTFFWFPIECDDSFAFNHKRIELQKSSERRRQLSYENSEIKAQITDRIGQLSHRNIESSNSPSDSRLEADYTGNNVSDSLI